MMITPQELRYTKGSVWVKAVQIHVYKETSRKYDGGKFIAFYSFSIPGQIFYGETLKDEASRPMLWDTEEDALKYAKIFFEYILA
jgi:hypothetical protein